MSDSDLEHALAQTEEALARQRQLLQSVLDSIGDGVAVADEEGKYLLFNPAARQILGTDVSMVMTPPEGWSVYLGLYLPDQTTLYPAQELPLARAMKGGAVTNAELFLRNTYAPVGAWLSVTARPMLDEEGLVRGGVAVFRDVTERHRAEATLRQAEEKYRRLLDSTGEGVYGVDRDGRCTFINRAAARMLGYQHEELLGRELHSLIHCPAANGTPAATCPIEAVLTTGQSCRLEDERFWRRDGTALPVECCASPILEAGAAQGAVVTFTDISERKRAVEELRKSRERFELAVLGSGAGLWDWDVETNAVYFSPQWKAMLGYQDHELADNFAEWEKRLHPADRERALGAVEAYFKGTTQTYELEHRLQCKDGSYRWILARGVAVRNVDGKPYRMAGSQIDITPHKLAEQALRDSEALYQSLVETLPLNVFRKDRAGKFTFANRRFVALLGRPLPEILGKTDFDFYPAELALKYQADDEQVLAVGQVFDDIEEHRKPDGSKIYVQVLKAPVYDSTGAIVGTEAIFWDVTPRKLAEAALQQAKEAAEAASRAKSEFLANMSHEIRTPMNAIVGMTELVLDTTLTAEQRECLDLVKKSADALLGIINDILDFSKIEAGKLELEQQPFHLRDCLADTLRTLSHRAAQKELKLTCRVAPSLPNQLVGDPGRLRQVLLNLLGNALKFTEHGEVSLSVASTEENPVASGLDARSDFMLQFTIADTGIGIDPSKLQIIFAPFVQADGSTTRKYGGTGLGLAITARLVSIMHGRVWAESEPGQGSRFHFTARFHLSPTSSESLTGSEPPRSSAFAAGTVAGPGVSSPGAGPLLPLRVLLVEDNPVNQTLALRILEKQHHHVTIANNGLEALAHLGISGGRQAATPAAFDLVLMDVQMPGMDGYETTRRIRRHELEMGGRLPILAMTAYAMKGDQECCLAAGMDAYISKPVRVQELLDTMQRLVAPVAPPLPEVPDAPVEDAVDWATALEYVGGDRGLLKELVLIFIAECPSWLKELRTGLDQKNQVAAQRAAHKLKGTLGNFGADAAYETAQRLETMCRTSDLDDVATVWALLEQELLRLLPALAAWAREC